MPRRILILAATTGYGTRVFEAAAHELGLDVSLATDRCHQLEDPWGDSAIAVRFDEPEVAVQLLADAAATPNGVVAVGDRPTVIAALLAQNLGLPYHPVEAVRAARNKFEARERFRTAGMLVPDYFRVPLAVESPEAARSARYPCVLKPLALSASRGVIRANDELDFCDAFERIRSILEVPEIQRAHDAANGYIQVETYIEGREFALEGLLTDGVLTILAIFDKPDPLEGPYFEETIYITPSKESPAVQQSLIDATQQAARALGLTNGPIHAEMRYNDRGVWMLEVAARPIGGLCSKCLQFSGGASLEQVVIRHALGEDMSKVHLSNGASGVMMIPIPENGIYMGVDGTTEAKAVPGIDDVIVTAKEGQKLLKLPEGASYLGFLFARGTGSQEVEAALRAAHDQLRFKIAKELSVLKSGVT